MWVQRYEWTFSLYTHLFDPMLIQQRCSFCYSSINMPLRAMCRSYLVAPCVLDLLATPDQAGLVLLSDPCILRTDTTLWLSTNTAKTRCNYVASRSVSSTVSRISISAITPGSTFVAFISVQGPIQISFVDNTNIINLFWEKQIW